MINRFNHNWKQIYERYNGGQTVGCPRTKFKCSNCSLETEYTRESYFKFLKQFENIECIGAMNHNV